MDDYLSIPTETIVNNSDTVFVSDYKYLPLEEAKSITLSQLKKLEADLHTLRVVFVSNGENPDVPISQNRTVGQEMKRVSETIKTLESYFSSILS